MTDISYSYNSVSIYCQDWFSVEYDVFGANLFAPCMTHTTVPSNIYGYSFASSGDNYSGASLIAISGDTISLREVLSSKLNQSLEANKYYHVSFFIKNAKTHEINYTLNKIGVVFTSDTLKNNSVNNINPSVSSEKKIEANGNWQKLEFYYKANGNENFLNIGVFGDDFEYTFGDPSRQWKPFYYFVDDVSVEEVDIMLNVYANVFTPNNDGENDYYLIKNEGFEFVTVNVFNRWGKEIYSYDATKTSWDGATYSGNKVPQGVYYLSVVAEDITGKVWTERKTVSVFY